MTKSPRSKHGRLSPSDWSDRSDDELLQLRVRDLGLQISTSRLEPFIAQLYEELDAQGLTFRPPCYLADEWFCPDKVPMIAFPFCLAHARLMQLEKKIMFEVEGDSPENCMRLLRHECGHAINYAYQLYKRTRWRELFGQFSTSYTSNYSFHPYSRHYVAHLGDSYAQAHPDEDFAETFAVWLTPGRTWEQKYDDWPVIGKLRYVDKLMARIGEQPPINTERDMPYSATRMTSTLAAFYERKRKVLGEEFSGYYDDALKRIFAQSTTRADAVKASRFLRRHRRQIVDSVTAWTPQRKFDVNHLTQRLIRRCDTLGLYVKTSDATCLIDSTALISATVNRVLRKHDSKDPS